MDKIPLSSTQKGPAADLDGNLQYDTDEPEEEQGDSASPSSEEQVYENHQQVHEDEWSLLSPF